MSVLTLHLKITLMGEYTSLSTPQSYKGRNDLEISNYFEKLQFKFNKFKCFVCSNKTVSGCFTQKQSLTAKQAPALFALCWSATYIHPNRNQIVKNKSQQNQISSIFVANSRSPVEFVPTLHYSSDGKAAWARSSLPILRAEDIKWRHTWSDTNLAGPKQFPDSSLTLATGAVVTLRCSVTTCSGINAASHVDVSQHIHVNGALVAPALCLELSSWLVSIKEGKMAQNCNVMWTYQTCSACN